MAARALGDDPHPTVEATLSLEPGIDAAAAARSFVEDNRDHMDPELVADAELLVSEIVTNAVRHGDGEIVLRLRVDPLGIGVSVTDTGERLPVVTGTPPPADQASGRGLLIVEALSTDWGVHARHPPPGKTVWFDVRTRRGTASQ